jgi:hypothetical protein
MTWTSFIYPEIWTKVDLLWMPYWIFEFPKRRRISLPASLEEFWSVEIAGTCLKCCVSDVCTRLLRKNSSPRNRWCEVIPVSQQSPCILLVKAHWLLQEELRGSVLCVSSWSDVPWVSSFLKSEAFPYWYALSLPVLMLGLAWSYCEFTVESISTYIWHMWLAFDFFRSMERTFYLPRNNWCFSWIACRRIHLTQNLTSNTLL